MLKSRFENLFHLIITLLSLALIIFIVLFSNKTTKIELKIGDVSEDDVYAPRAIVDEKTTAALREAARLNIPDVYVRNDDKRLSAVDDVKAVFDYATTLKQKADAAPSEGARELRASVKLNISEDTAKEIMNATDAQFSQMRKSSEIVNNVMSGNVSDVSLAKKDCSESVNVLNITQPQKNAANEIIALVITENMELDKAETERRRQAAEDNVPVIEYKKNQIIVRKGEVVSEAQIEMLRTLGMLKGTSPISLTYMIGVLLFIIIGYSILFYSLGIKRKGTSTLTVVSVVGLITVLMSYYGSRFVPSNMISILPFGIFPEIVALFTTPQAAIISNAIFAIFCGIEFEANWSLTICLIIAGTMSSYSFANVKRRSHLLPAAIISSIFYAFTFSAMSFVEASSVTSAFVSLGKGFMGGFLSGLIAIGSIQFFEWLFNATTPMKLSELTNPENKLLKKLLVEAPGSYHHSLTVANISEIAARSIGANSLLARVGAYYHDIGKIRHPLYYKENQYDKNFHDDLKPEESSSLIISHVTAGVDIALKNHLPKVVCDIIAQHHGTTTTGYFLIRAKELDPDADPEKFTYPGPVPQTKEAAIVMLADSCEAAVRSIDEKSEIKIDKMVRRLASERVNSGQFSECNLTFSELETVIRVITKTLGGYFHERIKYE